MDTRSIRFNRPHLTGEEIANIIAVGSNGMLAGDGPFTKLCHKWLETQTKAGHALLTHSCTEALEAAALLLDIAPGDEIIMPSYTFSSTANAFVLRGGVPVFIDIREDTMNMDERLIENAITSRTKAIVPVHYAGVACDMEVILAIAQKYQLHVVEDAAQGMMASYKGRALGTIGDLGTYSFHETKNVISGEGGALLINDPRLVRRAEIIREKGTDRSRFLRGEVDKYTWQDVGSSSLPGEMVAAFLWAQLNNAEIITQERLRAWDYYHSSLEEIEAEGLLHRPTVPQECQHNGHIYFVVMNDESWRDVALSEFRQQGIKATFHYVPLHSSPAGKRYARPHGDLKITDGISQRLIRLPMWFGISQQEQDRVVSVLRSLLSVHREQGKIPA